MTNESQLPEWMTPVPNPAPLSQRAQDAIGMAAIKGLSWTDFMSADGRSLVLRGRKRQTLLMLSAAASVGAGVLKTELPGNGAAAVKALSEAGISIFRLEETTNDAATVFGTGQSTSYLLGEHWEHTSGLYASSTQAQAVMALGDGRKAGAKTISPTVVARPYIRSGLISDHLEIEPLKANRSAAAESIRTGRAIRDARADSKRARTRQTRELDLRGGGQLRPARQGKGGGK